MKLKGDLSDNANAIVDTDLVIIESNSSFQEFFKNQKKWGKSKIKITQLIDFENISKFKKTLQKSKKDGQLKEVTFHGKIKTSKTNQPILVKISQPRISSKQWTNQVVNLTCETVLDLSDYSKINQLLLNFLPFDIFLLDHSFRIIYSNIDSKKDIKKAFKTRLKKDVESLIKKRDNKLWNDNVNDILLGKNELLEQHETLANEKYIIIFSPFKNQKGQITGCIISLKKLSELDRMDQNIFEKEIKNLKSREEISKRYQIQLKEELDSKLRELYSNLMLMSQKNQLINSIEHRIKKVLSSSKNEVFDELRQIMKLINSQTKIDDYWEKFKIHFVKINPRFFFNLQKRSKELSENDLRHCAYIKIGLSVKETAQLLSVLPSSIEMARYRIKKKLNLSKEQKLSNYVKEL